MREELFDVVVVGAGGAGLAAAIEAAELGRTVVLLEKNAAPGGSTGWSIGSVSASATPHQIARGIVDRPEDHWRDMAAFNGALDNRDNPELRRVLADGMPETFRWLLASGVRFFGPMPEPPHGRPRMHNVLPNSKAYIHHLTRRARRAGVDIRTETRVDRLVPEDGAVRALEATTANGRRRFSARGGVVLAAGDFTADPELKARFMGVREAQVEAVNPTATGDGQTLAMALGAEVVNGDQALGPELRFVAPAKPKPIQRIPPWPWLAELMAWSLDHLPDRLLRPFLMSFVTTALAPSPALFEHGALLVNRDGARFTSETEEPAYALAGQPGKIGYILLDARAAGLFEAWPNFVSTAPGVAYAYLADYRRNRRDVFNQAQSLSALAARLGMQPATLVAAVEDYNADAGDRPRFTDGPVVALGPVRPVFVHAEGGLAVDGQHRVLTPGGPIEGLYAAGSTGQGGLLLKGHGHHLAWAFVSGRRAGRLAALEVARDGAV